MIICANRNGGKIGIDRIGARSTRAPLAQKTDPLTERGRGLICGPISYHLEAQSIREWLIILDHCCEAYLRATVE
jgi:hypothetical protein